MILLFWLSIAGIWYAYLGYPMLLYLINKLTGAADHSDQYDTEFTPSISVIIPVFNEEKIIERKMENIHQLNYPESKIEVLIVSDHSTDRTKEIVERNSDSIVKFLELPSRGGKNAVLNLGMKEAKNEIIVFSDASIMLDSDALKNIVNKFQNAEIGCISGEDHIAEAGGEGLYGKYELYMRNQVSRLHSIVGASGSIYAQRKDLCEPFEEGMAPDFLSVLKTVEKGYRAVSEPRAHGMMTSVKSTQGEFSRKVRTLIRGMTALFFMKNLLNPFKYGMFSFILLSHKIMRWLVPLFMCSLFISNIFLLSTTVYLLFFIAQAVYYLLALISVTKVFELHKRLLCKIPLYFLTVNAAILVAWIKYISGFRQEVWTPSARKT